MQLFTVTVYSGIYKEKITVEATNQHHLNQRIKGMGYDRLTAIHSSRPIK